MQETLIRGRWWFIVQTVDRLVLFEQTDFIALTFKNWAKFKIISWDISSWLAYVLCNPLNDELNDCSLIGTSQWYLIWNLF